MLPLGLSSLELRNIIECAFLPLHCTCSYAEQNSLTVQISDSPGGQVRLRKVGITPDRLASSRSISGLIGELRLELAAVQHQHQMQSGAFAGKQARFG